MRPIHISYEENQSEEYNKCLKEAVKRLARNYIREMSFLGAGGLATLASLATFPQNPEYRAVCFGLSGILFAAKGIESMVTYLSMIKEEESKLDKLRK